MKKTLIALLGCCFLQCAFADGNYVNKARTTISSAVHDVANFALLDQFGEHQNLYLNSDQDFIVLVSFSSTSQNINKNLDHLKNLKNIAGKKMF